MMGKRTQTKLHAQETKWNIYLLLGVALFSLTSFAAKETSPADGYVKLSSTQTASTMSAPLQVLPRSSAVLVQSDEAHLQSDTAALPDVSVTCARSDFVVRVKSGFYGLGADASELTLGSTCKSNGVRPNGDLLFTYPLTGCGSVLELLPGYLVYKFVLRYDPSPGHFLSEALPVTVNIECRYQRNHYLHKLAVQPTWKTRNVHKRLRSSQTNFQIQLMDGPLLGSMVMENFPQYGNKLIILHRDKQVAPVHHEATAQVCAQGRPQTIELYINVTNTYNLIKTSEDPFKDTWENPVKSRVFQLGETVNFQVSAPHLLPGRKLYINSCYATPVTHSKSNVKFTIIDNYGCLMDSKVEPGASKFITRTDKSVRFSIKAFQFVTDPDSEISMHCQLHVTSAGPSHAHKSCTYMHKRWEALSGDDVICKCCDSQCVTSKRQRAMMDGVTSSRSLWVSNHPDLSSSGVNATGVDKMTDGAEKTKHKEVNLKEAIDRTHVEINGEKMSDLEELKWYMHNPEDENVQVIESKDDMFDVNQVNYTRERLEYQRIKLQTAQPLDTVGSEKAEIKQVLKQSNSDKKVKVLDGKDTTWYFTWR